MLEQSFSFQQSPDLFVINFLLFDCVEVLGQFIQFEIMEISMRIITFLDDLYSWYLDHLFHGNHFLFAFAATLVFGLL